MTEIRTMIRLVTSSIRDYRGRMKSSRCFAHSARSMPKGARDLAHRQNAFVSLESRESLRFICGKACAFGSAIELILSGHISTKMLCQNLYLEVQTEKARSCVNSISQN